MPKNQFFTVFRFLYICSSTYKKKGVSRGEEENPGRKVFSKESR
jgi:hypothetical protein